MNCEETQDLLSAYADRELDPVKSLALEGHLSGCLACSGKYASLRALRSAVSTVYHTPPDSLQKRIADQFKVVEKGAIRSPFVFGWRWIAVAGSVVLVLLASWTVFRLTAGPSQDELVAREAVSNHVRSLMVNHLVDVPSSDQHTVKPWFNGKLDFSPPVINLEDQGFPLVGGRLEYFDSRAVAALVYQRNKHVINLFVWPTDDTDASIHTATHQGYNVAHWCQADMSYWAVSELNANDLREFVQLVRTR